MFNSAKYPRNYPNIKYMVVVNIVTIIGSPEPPLNCNVSIGKTQSLDIVCEPGFDGGLPQEFTIIVINDDLNVVVINKTSIFPSFSIQGIQYFLYIRI